MTSFSLSLSLSLSLSRGIGKKMIMEGGNERYEKRKRVKRVKIGIGNVRMMKGRRKMGG